MTSINERWETTDTPTKIIVGIGMIICIIAIAYYCTGLKEPIDAILYPSKATAQAITPIRLPK